MNGIQAHGRQCPQDIRWLIIANDISHMFSHTTIIPSRSLANETKRTHRHCINKRIYRIDFGFGCHMWIVYLGVILRDNDPLTVTKKQIESISSRIRRHDWYQNTPILSNNLEIVRLLPIFQLLQFLWSTQLLYYGVVVVGFLSIRHTQEKHMKSILQMWRKLSVSGNRIALERKSHFYIDSIQCNRFSFSIHLLDLSIVHS